MTILFIFILGLAVGSFLNVCIDRLPAEESINGRSHCDYCKKKLGVLELIPVLSFIVLKGKCRYCKKKLSLFYPFVEVLTGCAFVLVSLYVIASLPIISGGAAISSVGIASSFHLNMTPRNDIIVVMIGLISYLSLISSLIVIFFADLKYHIIPDQATVAIILFSIPLVWLEAPTLQNFLMHILGGVLLFMILFALYHGSIFVLKREGMGFGDVKLAFAMGFLLGPKAGGIALYLSFILGGIVSLLLIVLNRRGMKSMIAFGPFMVIGMVLMLFFEYKIISVVKQFLPF